MRQAAYRLRSAGRWIAEALFPLCCASCGAMLGRRPDVGLPLCPACLASVVRVAEPWCSRCGLPLESPASRCPDCSRSLPGFDACRAVFVYAGAAKDLVLSLKHGAAFELAWPLGRLMAATAVVTGLARVDLVVPVPVTPVRARVRGYNQAALLARAVGKSLGVAAGMRALRRVLDPGPQGHHSREERRARVRGCFEVSRGAEVDGRRVLLIDDVVTTGATASECARVLKEAGASFVGVLAVARAA